MALQESRREESMQANVCKDVRRQHSWKWKAIALIRYPKTGLTWSFGRIHWYEELRSCCFPAVATYMQGQLLCPGPSAKASAAAPEWRLWGCGLLLAILTRNIPAASAELWGLNDVSILFLLDIFRYLQNLETSRPNAVKTGSYGYFPGIFPPFLLAHKARNK